MRLFSAAVRRDSASSRPSSSSAAGGGGLGGGDGELVLSETVDAKSLLQFAANSNNTGIYVHKVGEGSNTPRVREGDVVVAVDGKSVLSLGLTADALSTLVRSSRRGVKLDLSRLAAPPPPPPPPPSNAIPVSSAAAASMISGADLLLPIAQEVPASSSLAAPTPPNNNNNNKPPSSSSSSLQVGTKLDVLHKSPMDGKVRDQATDTSPEPNTGWRWRPCTVTELLPAASRGPEMMRVAFLDQQQRGAGGYASEAVVPRAYDPATQAPVHSKSPEHVMHHTYKSDDVLDVLDYYASKFDGRMLQKWRKCQVINVRQNYIRVTFCGWSSRFDLSLHVLEEADRMAEFGRYTERQQVEETQREVDFRTQLLQRNHMRVVDVSPDGNCLFRSISVLLYGGSQGHHEEIRNRVCDYLLNESSRFELFLIAEDESGEEFTFADYVRNMRRLAEWGGEPELRIVEEIYDRPVEVYSCDLVGSKDEPGRDFTLPVAHYNDEEEDRACAGKEPLRLSFHGNNHYNAVVMVKKKGEKGEEEAFDPRPDVNEGKIRALRKAAAAAAPEQLSRRMSFRAPSMSRSEPK